MNTTQQSQRYKLDRYTISIKLLTPLHIGQGPDAILQPWEYYIDKNRLYRINFSTVLDDFNPQTKGEFHQALVKQDTSKLQEIIKKSITRESKSYLYDIPLSPDIDVHLLKNKKIFPLIRIDEVKEPYIPGSSVKGAIRTALLSGYNNGTFSFVEEKKKNGNPKKTRKERIPFLDKYYDPRNHDDENLEAKIFNYWEKDEKGNYFRNISNDPLKHLKISDCIAEKNTSCALANIVNIGSIRGKNHPYRISNQCEVLLSGSVLKGTVTIMKNWSTEKNRFESIFHDVDYGIENMAKNCNQYYKNLYPDDANHIQKDDKNYKMKRKLHDNAQTNGEIIKNSFDNAKVEIPDMRGNPFILRLGKFTGRQYHMYYEKNETERFPLTRNIFGNPEYQTSPSSKASFGTSVLPTENKEHTLLPLGWVKVEFTPI